jgi:hypothetical protein
VRHDIISSGEIASKDRTCDRDKGIERGIAGATLLLKQSSKQRCICSTLLLLDGAMRTMHASNENSSSSSSAITLLDENKILLIISKQFYNFTSDFYCHCIDK